jgi:hypothetical protein
MPVYKSLQPEGSNLHSHRRENLKSKGKLFVCSFLQHLCVDPCWITCLVVAINWRSISFVYQNRKEIYFHGFPSHTDEKPNFKNQWLTRLDTPRKPSSLTACKSTSIEVKDKDCRTLPCIKEIIRGEFVPPKLTFNQILYLRVKKRSSAGQMNLTS